MGWPRLRAARARGRARRPQPHRQDGPRPAHRDAELCGGGLLPDPAGRREARDRASARAARVEIRTREGRRAQRQAHALLPGDEPCAASAQPPPVTLAPSLALSSERPTSVANSARSCCRLPGSSASTPLQTTSSAVLLNRPLLDTPTNVGGSPALRKSALEQERVRGQSRAPPTALHRKRAGRALADDHPVRALISMLFVWEGESTARALVLVFRQIAHKTISKQMVTVWPKRHRTWSCDHAFEQKRGPIRALCVRSKTSGTPRRRSRTTRRRWAAKLSIQNRRFRLLRQQRDVGLQALSET